MVNRGWVPVHQMSRESRAKNEPKGTVTLEAIVRKSEKVILSWILFRNYFRDHNSSDRMSQSKESGSTRTSSRWLDTTGRHRSTWKPFTVSSFSQCYFRSISESSQPGGPIGGQTNVSVRNEHLSYLITWSVLLLFLSKSIFRYSLTAVTLAMWLVRFRK